MADFANWAIACKSALWESGAFLNAYDADILAAVESVLEASPVAVAVRKLMEPVAKTPKGEKEPAPPWAGTASELLEKLTGLVTERVAKSDAWPGKFGAAHRRQGSTSRLAQILVRQSKASRFHRSDAVRPASHSSDFNRSSKLRPSRNSRSFTGPPQAAWRSSWCYGRSRPATRRPARRSRPRSDEPVFVDPPLVPDLLERPALDYSLSHRPRPHRYSGLFGLQGGGPLPSQFELPLGAPEVPLGPQNPGIGLGDRLLGLRQPLLCVHYGAPGPLNLFPGPFRSPAHPPRAALSARSFKISSKVPALRFKSNGPLKART